MDKPTFADLEKDLKQKAIIQAAEELHGSPLPKDIQLLMLDIAIQSSINVQNTLKWIISLESISNSIISSTAHRSDYPLFWIYLYGIVIEFHSHLIERRELYEKVDFLKPVLDSAEMILATLATDNISFIKFMRHSHVHISLDYIWHQAKMKDGELSEVKPPYDSDAIEISQRIIEEHGGDQQAVALTFASKIINDVSNLLQAANEAAS